MRRPRHHPPESERPRRRHLVFGLSDEPISHIAATITCDITMHAAKRAPVYPRIPLDMNQRSATGIAQNGNRDGRCSLS
jgi:hypothetical protein